MKPNIESLKTTKTYIPPAEFKRVELPVMPPSRGGNNFIGVRRLGSRVANSIQLNFFRSIQSQDSAGR